MSDADSPLTITVCPPLPSLWFACETALGSFVARLDVLGDSTILTSNPVERRRLLALMRAMLDTATKNLDAIEKVTEKEEADA